MKDNLWLKSCANVLFQDDDDDDDLIKDDRIGASASEGEEEISEGASEDEGEGSQASEPSSAQASPAVRRRKPPRAD